MPRRLFAGAPWLLSRDVWNAMLLHEPQMRLKLA
jgi:hypothetical protein